MLTLNNKKEPYYIGVDIGTTHIKSALFDQYGVLMKSNKEATPTSKDQYGTIYDPFEFYKVVIKQISEFTYNQLNIKGISITGMSEAGLVVNQKEGIEETPIIPWFDQRTSELAKQIKSQQEIKNFYSTGLHNSYKYGIYKYLWLLDHYKLNKEEMIWLSVTDYIAWKLTGEFATDPSFAARTYVYDIFNHCWDKQRIGEYGLTQNNFPKVIDSGKMIGYLLEDNLNIKANYIMVCSGGHDHVCAAYSVLDDDPKQICNSIGTAETYIGYENHLTMDQSRYESGMNFGPYINGNGYFWMTNIPSSGQSVEWFRNKVQKSHIGYEEMNQLLESINQEPTDILYYPYLSGMGTPHYLADVGGGFLGLCETHSLEDLLKAIIEGTNYQGKWILSLLPQHIKQYITHIICVGGATNSSPWMQIKTNVLGLPVQVTDISEHTLRGAVGIMIFKNYGIAYKNRFLGKDNKEIKWFQVNQAVNKLYENTYKDKYLQVVDTIIKLSRK